VRRPVLGIEHMLGFGTLSFGDFGFAMT